MEDEGIPEMFRAKLQDCEWLTQHQTLITRRSSITRRRSPDVRADDLRLQKRL
jgi:hypothetical protein